MRLTTTMALLVAVIAEACTVGPDYVRPNAQTPPAWRIDYPQAAGVANTRWWEQFGDPVLTALIDEALVNNKDLAIAAARVDAFIGRLDTTRAQFYPQANYSADASRNRTTRVGTSPLPPDASPYYTLYQGALGANWQVDLFGRVRRQTESAQAQVYASEQGRRGVVLSVVTSMATAYVTLRALDRQLEIARATERNYAGSLQLFEARHKGGTVSELERSQVESQYRQAQAAVPAFERLVAQQENLLSVLVARNPGAIARGKPIEELLDP